MKRLLLSAIMMILIIPGFAAGEVQFTASARKLVSVGDRFQLTYTANVSGGKFKAPSIENFRVLSGPNISTSQSYQVINGRMTQSVSVSYVYYLQAYAEGTFKIPPAGLDHEGKEYQSNAVEIKVIQGNAQASAANAGNQGAQKATADQSQQQSTGDDVFLRTYVSNRNPYQGEQVIVTYKIYTANVPISEIDFQNSASFPGFWATNLLDTRQQIQPEEEVIDGRQFLSGTLYRGALFPQKSGSITIGPKKLNCTAQIRTEGVKRVRDPFFDSFFDDPFFNNRYKNVRLELESNAVNINVKPLPVEGKPAGYSGAVGSFSLKGSVDNTELKVNDAITLKLEISGSGNLELINTPDVNWPPDFETYEPKVINNLSTSNSGVSGSRTFEFLAIPRSAGDFTLDPIELSYFDPRSETYKKLKTEAFHFKVEKGDQSNGTVSYSSVAQEDIMYIGQDIRYIKTGNIVLSSRGYYLFNSALFYILIAVPIVLLLITIIIIKSNRKKRRNVALVRNRKATRVARKNLKKAKEFMRSQQQEEFYTEISRALWGYLSDKFNIPLSGLSMDSVSKHLASRQVSDDSIAKFIEVLNNCEFARFAPGESKGRMNEIYNESILLISKIESELKA
ncbi:MAG: BatD family protein [Bacteroidales bacterium]|nr:BatD family protein [Bacteroidales bacterium]